MNKTNFIHAAWAVGMQLIGLQTSLTTHGLIGA